MNRRGMLRFATAGVALMMLRRAAAAGDDPGQPFMTVIYDERHADARAFANRLQRLGAASFPTRGDATALWYGGALPRNGGAIAGLTTWSDLVIARSRGREFGLRLVFEKPHDRGSDITHYLDRVPGPHRMPEQAGRDAIETTAPAISDRPDHLIAWLLMPRTVRAAG